MSIYFPGRLDDLVLEQLLQVNIINMAKALFSTDTHTHFFVVVIALPNRGNAPVTEYTAKLFGCRADGGYTLLKRSMEMDNPLNALHHLEALMEEEVWKLTCSRS